jgi:hypothetical protein
VFATGDFPTVTAEELRPLLAFGIAAPKLAELRKRLGKLPSVTVFRALFPIALDAGEELAADQLAAQMLVDLEPECPVSCEDALRMVAAGRWNVSDKLVPFYLISQFGKFRLAGAIQTILAEGLGQEARVMVAGVGYWARLPTVEMISWYAESRRDRLMREVGLGEPDAAPDPAREFGSGSS